MKKKQVLETKIPFCEFYNRECNRFRCPSFRARRPMTERERGHILADDIPLIDPYVYDWCTKYEIQVSKEYIIRNVG